MSSAYTICTVTGVWPWPYLVQFGGRIGGRGGGLEARAMEIIELPAWRLSGDVPDRAALRAGLAASLPVVHVVKDGQSAGYCDRCAGPVEFGAVMRGGGTYCSVECSLEGPNRTA